MLDNEWRMWNSTTLAGKLGMILAWYYDDDTNPCGRGENEIERVADLIGQIPILLSGRYDDVDLRGYYDALLEWQGEDRSIDQLRKTVSAEYLRRQA